MTEQISQPQRHIPLDGARNVRDLGGYRTRGSGTTRWGRVYRADGLSNLTDRDVGRFDSLGIATVFDLRSDAERAARPNRVASVPWCVMTPVEEAGVSPVDRTALQDKRSAELHLRQIYSNLIAHSGLMFATMISEMSRPGGLPVLFHCHAGKDRTGVAAALLLSLVGVPREAVLDDYELTEVYRRPGRKHESAESMIASGIGEAAAIGMIGAPRWALEATLDQVDRLGGAEAYLLDTGGIDTDAITRLRRELVQAE